MSICETCEVNPCPGAMHGMFCTRLSDRNEMEFHPAVMDIQGPLSCEMTFFYERPAVEQIRQEDEEIVVVYQSPSTSASD